MSGQSFFDEATEQSAVKMAIISKYFWAWAKVIMAATKGRIGPQEIAYIDLFAGPGRYKDGTKSTPLLVLDRAIREPDMASRLVTIFNDADDDSSQSLEREIHLLPGILKFRLL